MQTTLHNRLLIDRLLIDRLLIDMPDEISVPTLADQMSIDAQFMREAIAQAQLAGQAGDVPVGAVIVIDNTVVASGHNRREVSGDPTAHAEILALRSASAITGRWHIEGTLYVTQEPCPMCAGALVNARVQRLVYGCANPKAGAVDSLFSIVTDPRLNHRMPVTSGILAAECASLLQDFFKSIRARRAAQQNSS